MEHEAASVLLPEREEFGAVGVDAVVGEVAVWENSGVSTWSGGHFPSVNLFAVVVDYLDDAWAGEVGVEHESRRDFVVVYASKADSSSMQCALLHG